MAEEEVRAKLEAEEKERREPKSIPVIGGHLDFDEGSNSNKVKTAVFCFLCTYNRQLSLILASVHSPLECQLTSPSHENGTFFAGRLDSLQKSH